MYSVLFRQKTNPVSCNFVVFSKLSCSDTAVTRTTAEEVKLKQLVTNYSYEQVEKQKYQSCFIQNLFINNFNPKVLEYPQLSSLKRFESLKKLYLAAELLLDSSDKKLIESGNRSLITTIKDKELTGFKLPQNRRGFGYNHQETAFIQEALGSNSSLSKCITENEEFGIQVINLYGSDTQKESYLFKLASGEITSSFAHSESDSGGLLDPDLVNTVAVQSSDSQSYTISGTKNSVYNAKHSDVFIVSAKIKSEDSSENQTEPTLFLVYKSTPGIKIHDPINTIGLKGLSVCDVSFNDVIVPVENILGKPNEGGSIIRKILSNGKLSNGTTCLPIMRKLVTMSIKHCIDNTFCDKDKHEMEYYRIKIGEMVTILYAVESMTYLLTGRLDWHDTDADVYLESLILKIFASESLLQIFQQSVEIVGKEVFTSNNDWQEILRDTPFFAACDITNDKLRILLSIAGLEFAMDYEKTLPALKQFFKKLSSSKSKTSLKEKQKLKVKRILQGYLHPMFKQESVLLEQAVELLAENTNDLLTTYKDKVFHQPAKLKMLADIVINIYAMAATLGRASRSYCIGVERYNVDDLIAQNVIRRYFTAIWRTCQYSEDIRTASDLTDIGSKVFASKNYGELLPVVESLKIRQKNTSKH